MSKKAVKIGAVLVVIIAIIVAGPNIDINKLAGSISGADVINDSTQEVHYNVAVDNIMNENYLSASEELSQIQIHDSESLKSYCALQEAINDYDGLPGDFLADLKMVEEIDNSDVKKQFEDVCTQMETACDIQERIDSINKEELGSESIDVISQITEDMDGLDERYANIIDTTKYDFAVEILDNIENETDIGLTILAIEDLDDVTLSSKDDIELARSRYDDLSKTEKVDVVNYNELVIAEEKLERLEKKQDAKEKAEREKQAKKELEEKKKQEKRAAKKAEKELQDRIDNTTVFYTKTGSCYHVSGCSYLRSSCYETTYRNAKAMGLEPCSRCNAYYWVNNQ